MCVGDYDFGKTSPCLLEVKVKGHTVDSLIDTGATVSLVSERMARDLGLIDKMRPWEMGPVKAADSAALDILGALTISVRVGLANLTFDVIVARNLSRGMIIRKNVLGQVGTVIDLKRETITLDGCKPVSLKQCSMKSMEIGHAVMAVFPTKDIIILPYSEMMIPLRVDHTKY